MPRSTPLRATGVVLSVAGLLLWLQTAAMANTHPELSPAQITSAQCVSCHAQEANRKLPHAAGAKGCLECHEVTVVGKITRVRLTDMPTLKLCVRCHADEDPAHARGKAHAPARECLSCHDAHGSDNKHDLLRPAAGRTKNENLCLQCHNTGMQKKNVHRALESGCNACHATHKNGSTADGKFHLAKRSPALCLSCHDDREPGMAEAHRNQPIAKSDCLTCHDPHESDRPKMLRAHLHKPFEKNECEACHKPAQNGKIVLTRSDVKQVCITCHEEEADEIDSSKVKHRGTKGPCTDCHTPHASNWRALPKSDPVSVCLGCHDDQAEEFRTQPVLHQPVFEQGCNVCHTPHGGDTPKLLRAKGNAVCVECHSSEAAAVKSDRGVAIFHGSVLLPSEYFATKQPVRFDLKDGVGHPTMRHPVVTPQSSSLNVEVGCLSCHQPHSGAARGMLVKNQAPGLQFCRTCHTGPIGAE